MNENKNVAVLSIVICWLFYLFSYVVRVEPSVLTNDLISEFNLNSSTLGFIISVSYLPYVLMQVPCGIITDKLGTKLMVIMSCLGCSLGAFIFGSATSTFQLELGRFFIGLSSASAFLCCGKIATDFFDKKKYAMLMGVAMCMGCLGGISGSAPTAYLVSKFGWREATYIIASFGGILVAMAAIFMKKVQSNTPANSNILTGLKAIAKNPKAWILGFYGCMTYLPLSAMAELWIVPFMEQRYGVSTEQAAFASIIIFIGFALGGVIAAWVAEKINSYKKTIIASTFGVLFAFCGAIYSDNITIISCMSLLFLGGICAGTNTLAFALAYSLVPKEFGGTSSGFTNMLIMMSGVIFQPLLGKLLDFFRNGLVDANGTPIYTLTMYRSAFFFVIIGMFFAIISTFFINDIKHKE